MGTSFEKIRNRFFDRIEKDDTFFNYLNLTDREAMELAIKRANLLLESAAIELTATCNSDVDFLDLDTDLEEYNFELTAMEVRLIVEIMFKQFMERDVPTLHVFALNFIPSEFNSFSPANERTSYLNLVKKLQEDVREMIDDYESQDRRTNKRKLIPYSSYFSEE